MFLFSFLITISLFLYAPHVRCQLRIYGGQDADIEDFPFMLSVNYQESYGFVCGAVLISQEWALTSVRCAYVIDTSSTAFLYSNSSIRDQGIKITIKNTVYHPDFDFQNLDNDLALFHIEQPTNCDICEPVKLSLTAPEVNDNVTLIGWGVVTLSGDLATTLQVIDLPVVDYEICKEKYATLPYSPVTVNKFCAGIDDGSYRGASILDYGGPALMNGELVGVISYAYSTLNEPYAVISKIANYVDWIGEVTGILIKF